MDPGGGFRYRTARLRRESRGQNLRHVLRLEWSQIVYLLNDVVETQQSARVLAVAGEQPLGPAVIEDRENVCHAPRAMAFQLFEVADGEKGIGVRSMRVL